MNPINRLLFGKLTIAGRNIPILNRKYIDSIRVYFPASYCIIWSNYSDLTRPHPKWWFSKGNPVISGNSRLVKYYNLARYNDRPDRQLERSTLPKTNIAIAHPTHFPASYFCSNRPLERSTLTILMVFSRKDGSIFQPAMCCIGRALGERARVRVERLPGNPKWWRG